MTWFIFGPKYQDRTTGIQKDENEFIDKNLVLLWEKLQLCEVDYVILPCMTSHYFVRQFPMGIDEQMISLIELTIREVEGSYSEFNTIS